MALLQSQSTCDVTQFDTFKEATRSDRPRAEFLHNRLENLIKSTPSLARYRRGGFCVRALTVVLCGSDVCVVDVGGGFRFLLALRPSFLWPVGTPQ